MVLEEQEPAADDDGVEDEIEADEHHRHAQEQRSEAKLQSAQTPKTIAASNTVTTSCWFQKSKKLPSAGETRPALSPGGC